MYIVVFPHTILYRILKENRIFAGLWYGSVNLLLVEAVFLLLKAKISRREVHHSLELLKHYCFLFGTLYGKLLNDLYAGYYCNFHVHVCIVMCFLYIHSNSAGMPQ